MGPKTLGAVLGTLGVPLETKGPVLRTEVVAQEGALGIRASSLTDPLLSSAPPDASPKGRHECIHPTYQEVPGVEQRETGFGKYLSKLLWTVQAQCMLDWIPAPCPSF